MNAERNSGEQNEDRFRDYFSAKSHPQIHLRVSIARKANFSASKADLINDQFTTDCPFQYLTLTPSVPNNQIQIKSRKKEKLDLVTSICLSICLPVCLPVCASVCLCHFPECSVISSFLPVSTSIRRSSFMSVVFIRHTFQSNDQS